MPPAISDEDISDTEMAATPNRSLRAKKPVKDAEIAPDLEDDDEMLETKDVTNGTAADEEDEEKEGDDEGEEAEEYVVEKILSHRWEKSTGMLKFEVKWEGWEKKSDRTWEPEENLAGTAPLEEYFESVGGRDKIIAETQNALKTKKRGRPQSDTPTSTSKRSRKNGDEHPGESTPPVTAQKATWKPPAGSWEDQIKDLDACEDEESGKLMVYLTWINGQKTQHETSVIYKRCPQKMLQFYERHVRIIKKDGDDAADEAVL